MPQADSQDQQPRGGSRLKRKAVSTSDGSAPTSRGKVVPGVPLFSAPAAQAPKGTIVIDSDEEDKIINETGLLSNFRTMPVRPRDQSVVSISFNGKRFAQVRCRGT